MKGYVLITGASSGIGKAFAYEYAKSGRNLILVARNQDKLTAIRDDLMNKFYVDVKVFLGDLSVESAAIQLFHAVKEKNLDVDVLVNNAGFGLKGEFVKNALRCYEDMMNLNMIALVELTYLFLKDMLERGKGTIINVGSMVSFFSTPYNTLYSATKAFVLSFTEGLYYEYKNKGIQFVAICPGATNTNFFDRAGKSKALGIMREPEQVVKSTLKALDRGKPFIVDGMRAKTIVTLSKLLPRKVFPILLSILDRK